MVHYKKATKVISLTDLKPGDHIRQKHVTYNHHMLVVCVLDERHVIVIHYNINQKDSKDSTDRVPKEQLLMGAEAFTKASSSSPFKLAAIMEDVCYFDLRKDRIELMEYSLGIALYTGPSAVDRAREKVGEAKYNLFFNNCESFVNWAITGEQDSDQGKKALRAVVGTVVAGGAIAIGVAGAVICGVVTVLSTSGKKRN